MIMEDWLEMRNKEERDVMITWTQRIRTLTGFAYFLMAITYIYAIFPPLFGFPPAYTTNITDKLLPIPSYYDYDIAKRPQYELTYISHALVSIFAGLSYTGIDNFLGLLVFHVCGQGNILSTRIMYLDKLIHFREGLKNRVMYHIRLLRAIAIIKDAYNIMLLALFLYFGISFAFYGFLIISEGDHVRIGLIILCICVILIIFIHVGLYCAVGEILVVQLDKFHNAIYNQKWYSLNPRNAKDLILLIIKSREATYITAGNVFPLTMVTFTNLLKTSAGYISVLLTIRN